MALDTYTNLQAAIADWMERDDLSARIPDFIRLAEVEMDRTLTTSEAQARSTASVDTQFTALPLDWMEVQAVRVRLNASDAWTKLDPIDHATMVGWADQAGRPRFYGVLGEQLFLYPSPDATYETEIAYATTVPKLSSSLASNWVLAQAPDAYLYGALVQASLFLRDAEGAKVWRDLFGSAMSQLLAARPLSLLHI